MEKFVEPANIEQFVKWTLDHCSLNHWKCLLEYSEPALLSILTKSAVFTDLPPTASHNHDDSSLLVAFEPKDTSIEFVRWLIANSHALSVYKGDQLLLLIADDYHPDCFSCSSEFYNRYLQEWLDIKAIVV